MDALSELQLLLEHEVVEDTLQQKQSQLNQILLGTIQGIYSSPREIFLEFITQKYAFLRPFPVLYAILILSPFPSIIFIFHLFPQRPFQHHSILQNIYPWYNDILSFERDKLL